MRALRTLFAGFDVWLFLGAITLSLMGLVTMYSYTGDNSFFEKQVVWVLVGGMVAVIASVSDYRFFRAGNNVFFVYLTTLLLLVAVLFFGEIVKGAQSRFDLGFFSLQPSDPAKLVLIALLAKYFSKRHVEIANVRHVLISGLYALIMFVLVFIQPDFGSALILFSIWFGMVLISGIPLKHIFVVIALGAVAFLGLWYGGFEEYQKDRIRTFLHPLADIQGTGYNAYQSTIAVGSGELWGKGIGYGTQSKLQFLPEYETDFIFAAFAEEWGFIGVVVMFMLFLAFLWRVVLRALEGESNFERLFGAGFAILITSHFSVHVGMNIGLLPVTGTTVPFLSYGGSHLITEFLGLGILIGMTKRRKRIATEPL